MILIVHAPFLTALMALQFHAAGWDKPTPFWLRLSRALTIVGAAIALLGLYVGDTVGVRALIAGVMIAAAGLARYREIDAVTRWFRWLRLASCCLCILASCGMIGVIISRRLFS
jgi:hypothetical protein